MELQIWKGDWGLPSVDLQCLAVIVSYIYHCYVLMMTYNFSQLYLNFYNALSIIHLKQLCHCHHQPLQSPSSIYLVNILGKVFIINSDLIFSDFLQDVWS